MGSPALSLTLLGGFRGRLASGRALALEKRKARALVAYLALSPGRTRTREELAALLWGDSSDVQARQSLRQAIRSLRSALGRANPALLIGDEALSLDPRHVRVDVWDFERLTGHTDRPTLRRASMLYCGDLLEGLGVESEPFEAWLRTHAERLRSLASGCLTRLLRLELQAGSPEAAAVAGHLLILDPSDEYAHRALMQFLARQGRVAAVHRQYQQCVDRLAEALGTVPSAETRALYQRLVDERSAGMLARASRRARRVTDRDAPPFVGRAEDITRLRDLTRRSASRKLHVVAIAGEAGVGKSRLVEEVVRKFEHHGGRVLIGCAYESEQIVPYGPWTAAVENSGVLADAALTSTLPRGCRAALGRLFPGLPGAGALDGPEHHRTLFEAFAVLLRRLAEQPLLLVLEDLHWADEMTIRLLPFLARRLCDTSLVALVTLRDEEVASTPLLPTVLEELRHEPSFVHLPVRPLSRGETVALARGVARSPAAVQEGVLDAVWRVSEGNPLVVIETMRGVDDGALVRDSEGLPMAPRIQELITARLERMSAPARTLAQTAAVIGRPFAYGLLLQASGLSEAEAGQGLGALVQRRVLRAEGDRLEFVHDRIRQAILASLLPARRTFLHAAVARSLEQVYAGQLSHHHAAIAVHARDGGLWLAAVEHFRQAGRQALARYARREAAECFREALRALDALSDEPERIALALDVRLELRSALRWLGELATVSRLLDETEDLAQRLGDRRRQAWIDTYRANDGYMRGRPREGLTRGRRAQAVAASLGDGALSVAADLFCGLCLAGVGDYGLAVGCLERAAAATGEGSGRNVLGWVGPPPLIARAFLSLVLGQLGAFERGVTIGGEALATAQAEQLPYASVQSCLCLAGLHVIRGAFPLAEALLEQGASLAREWEVSVLGSQIRREQGVCLVHSGRVAEGIEFLEGARRRAEAIGLSQPGFLTRLAEAYLTDGQERRALEIAEQSVALAQQQGERGQEAWAHRLLGEIRWQATPGDEKAAAAHFRDALAMADALGMRPLVAHCQAGLGRAERRTAPARAESALHTAATLYEQMGMTRWLEPLRAELTGAYAGQGRVP